MSSDEGMWDPSGDEDDSPWGCNTPKLGRNLPTHVQHIWVRIGELVLNNYHSLTQ
jgi:hypothetical protein